MHRTPYTRGAVALLVMLAACTGTTSSDGPSKAHTAKEQRLRASASNVSQAGNDFYQVFVTDLAQAGIGQYTIMTGANHPVTISTGSPKNVLFGGGNPGTSFNTIHSYTTGTDYVELGLGSAPNLVPLGPTTPGVTAAVTPIGTSGFQTTFTTSTPSVPDALKIVQIVAAHGSTFETSTVEVTTTITNTGTAPVSIGLRYLWDVQIGEDDGPTFQQFSPDAPPILTEKSYAPPTFAFYRIQDNNNNTPSPLFSVFGTVTGPTTITPVPTPPDVVDNASWPSSYGTRFFYTPTSEDVSSPNGIDDNAVLYYWGATQATAITIAPGASRTFSQSLVSAEANAPPPFNQSPVAHITAPTNNASFAQGASVSFAGTGTDPEDGALTGASLVWTDNVSATTIGTGTSFTLASLSVGTHVITLTATDSKGATGTASVTVIITGVAVNQPPTATITLPTNGATFVQGASVSFSGSGHDPEDGNVTGTALRWSSSLDGALTTGATFSRTNLSVGTHVITLTAVDSKGLTGTATVTIHITAPAQNQSPTATITAPTAGALLALGSSVSFAGTGSDPEDGALTGASLVWTDNVSGGQIGTGTSFSLTTLAVGPHIITLTATDSKGAKGAATVSITVGFSQTIGSAGGTLCVNSCHLSLFIPAGALHSSTTFFVWSVPAPSAPPGLVGMADVISPVVSFATNGELGLGYDPATLPAGISESSLRLSQYVGGSWQPTIASSVNTTSHIVYGQVTSTGIFAIIGTP
ncbi:MAG: PKD domain-containing protein [Gemmatimonadaceae bacterium]